MQRLKKGFTIFELVLVIFIVALLSTVLIPTFSNLITKAQKQRAISDAKNAFTSYTVDNTLVSQDNKYFIYESRNKYYITFKDNVMDTTIYTSMPEAFNSLITDNDDISESDKLKYSSRKTSVSNLSVIEYTESKLVTEKMTVSEKLSGYDLNLLVNHEIVDVKVNIPQNALKDKDSDVKVTVKQINPESTIKVDTDVKAFAYDIHVENIKDDIKKDEEITVTLTTLKALPSINVYHNGEKIDASYDPLTGEVTFKTKSFSPFALSYIEKTANTLDELREFSAIDNAYVKIGADITMNFDGYKEWDEETLRKNIDHAITIISGQMGVYDVPGYEEYRVAFCGVFVRGKNVTVDLNGHELLLTGHPKPCGAMFFVSEGTLNLTDSVGTGKAKVANSTYIVWSSWTRNTGTYTNIYDGIYMADTFTGDTDPNYGYKSNFNTAMIYAGYNNEQYGNINVYGGYFLYNNFPNDEKNTNNGAFNVGDSTTRVCLTVHEGVMLINQYWRQSSGTDDDSIALADGCEVVPVTLTTPMEIDGVSYSNWYKVVTNRPTFEKTFVNTDKYLYRLGNGNDIKLGSLFYHISNDSSSIKENAIVEVTITPVEGNVTGTYTASTSAQQWNNGTIKFTGTGLVKINLNGCELLVEVVDGNNATKQSDLSKAGNIILINDITFETKTNCVFESKTLYGNGFTINYNGYGNKDVNAQGVIELRNSTLDNVKVTGDKYSTFNDTSSNEYYSATVIARGVSKITNSYISNGQNAVRTEASSLIIENTTLYGGRYANMQVKGGIVTLKNVTTIQEKQEINGTTCLGFGIVVWENAVASTKVIVEGTINQNNWASRNDKEYLPGNAKNYAEAAFGMSQFVYTYNGTEYVNLGIISISQNVLSDKIIIPDTISYSKKDASGSACVVTCDKNKDGSRLNNGIPDITEWTATNQGAFVPTFNWDYPQGYNEAGGEITITFTQGDSYTFNPNFLTSTKHGYSLPVTVNMNNTDYTNENIIFTTAGEYVIKYTVTDEYNYGPNNTSYIVTYDFIVMVNVIVNAPDVKHATFSYTSGSGTRIVEIGGKTYVMPNVNGTSSTIASKTISGQTIYMPIVTAQYKNNSSDFDVYSPIFTAINITDYSPATSAGVKTTYNTSTRNMPSNLIYTGTGPTAPHLNSAGTKDGPMTYSSYGLCYRGVKGADISATTQTVEYCYTDNAGQAYYYYIQYSFPAHKKPTGCFTPDTLITLSNGTVKRVDEINTNDKLLVWDFFTGAYSEQNASLLVNHGYDNYEVVYTEYSDGTVLKTIAEHGLFDYDLNKFIYIDSDNVSDYIGHRFIKQSNSSNYDVITMTNAYVIEEYTQAWSITSSITSNAFAQGLLTVAPPEDFYNWIGMSGKLQYDVETFNNDVETYGLYTYDDFKDYVTYEQFIAWNGAYLKIPVEKGYFTFEYILELIELYKQWFNN